MNRRAIFALLLGLMVAVTACDTGSGQVGLDGSDEQPDEHDDEAGDEWPHEQVHEDVEPSAEAVHALGACPPQGHPAPEASQMGIGDLVTFPFEWVQIDAVNVIADEPAEDEIRENARDVTFDANVTSSQPWPEERTTDEAQWPDEGVEGSREFVASGEHLADIELALAADMFIALTVGQDSRMQHGIAVGDTAEGPKAASMGVCNDWHNDNLNAALLSMDADNYEEMVDIVAQLTVDGDQELREQFREHLRQGTAQTLPTPAGPEETVLDPDSVDQGALDAEVYDQLTEVDLWLELPDHWPYTNQVSVCPYLTDVGWSVCAGLHLAEQLEGRSVLWLPTEVGDDLDQVQLFVTEHADDPAPEVWERLQQHQAQVRWPDPAPVDSEVHYLLQLPGEDTEVDLDAILANNDTLVLEATEYDYDPAHHDL